MITRGDGHAPRRRREVLQPAAPLGPLVGALVLIVLATAVVVADRRLRFADLNPQGRVAVETAAALIGAFVGVVAIGRFRFSRSAADLGVAIAVFVLAFANIAFAAVPRSITGDDPEVFATWASLVARFVGAAALAIAPFVHARRTRQATARWIAAAGGATMLVILVAAGLLASELPDGVRIAPPTGAADRPVVEETALIVVAQLATGLAFAVAAAGFARRARAGGDVFARWLAAGAVLQAGARVHFAVFPSVYSDWLYTGDLLRLAGSVAWLTGAVAEIARSWHEREQLAVAEERRRLARDLHDGLVQDLSFIRSQTATDVTPSAEVMVHVAAAAERALIEARLAVEALADGDDVPPEVAFRRIAEQLAAPAGLTVSCSYQPGCTIAAPVQRELLRIVREATANVVKHAEATSIAIEVDGPPDGSVWLMVADDGRGFDVDAAADVGFGLTSMRERAERLGATLTVTSSSGGGTVVEVAVPPTEERAR